MVKEAEIEHDGKGGCTPDAVYRILSTVRDPEIPVLTILDLGIVREVRWSEIGPEREGWRITLSPTYTGCPATDMIAQQVRIALYAAGITDFLLETSLSPPWSTDWISSVGREKLRAYGIAPPSPWPGNDPVPCPHCGSTDTRLLSEFGSTPCKALRQCASCLEPFDHFKCHGRGMAASK